MAPPDRKTRTHGRLLDAVTRLAAEHGYGSLSAAGVAEAAGVARTTFYAHFEGVDAAFLAGLARIAAQLVTAVDGAVAAGCSGDIPALECAVQAVARFAIDEPSTARVLFAESLAAGTAARARRELTIDRVVAIVGEQEGRSCAPVSTAGIAMLVAGVFRLLAIRVSHGRLTTGRLDAEISAWARSYRGDWGQAQPATIVPPAGATGRRAGADTADRTRDPCMRILCATARLSRTHGYASVTVADICALAGVSRKTFYAHFTNKQQAACEMNEWTFQQSVARCTGSFFGAPDWPSRVWTAGHALADFLAANPDAAYLHFVECHAIGEPAVHHAYERLDPFTLFLEQGYRDTARDPRPPRIAAKAIAAVIFESLYHELTQPRAAHRLRDRLQLPVSICLLPFHPSGAPD